jgi:5'-methylthioadenosine phosphorylase
MNSTPIGVIGGSGLYDIEALEVSSQETIDTPFGDPSSPIVMGKLGEQEIAFIARHGIGHTLSPSEVNYRANIYALKALGIERVVSVSACGSLREDYAPGHVVIPDQIMDMTKLRARSFFDRGLVAHVSVADPFCPDLSEHMIASVQAAGGEAHAGGSYVTIEGPRFSTRAESNTFRAWGISIIGMTTSPEAFLAREAELCYGVMAHVTDYDVWHRSEEPVTVEMVVRTLQRNTKLAQDSLVELLARIPDARDCPCKDALKDALITSPDSIPQETLERLGPLVQRYYG